MRRGAIRLRWAVRRSLPADEARAACDALVPPGTAVVDFHNTAPWMKTVIPS